MSSSPIIVFDSGIGGFSILRHLSKYKGSYLYYADQANFPYGNLQLDKLTSVLTARAKDFLDYNPKAVVVACNTGTVTGISLMRKLLPCPVFGVEPVTKQMTQFHQPVVWGTKVTSHSARAKELVNRDGKHIRYYTPTNLAQAIETDNKLEQNQSLQQSCLDLQGVDAIGLSCTHYPLILEKIKTTFPDVTVYDPSLAVARHVARSLDLKEGKSSISYYSTLSVLRLKSQAAKYNL